VPQGRGDEERGEEGVKRGEGRTVLFEVVDVCDALGVRKLL
jgi:hypothetical protein